MFKYCKIKAMVVYRWSKVINRLRENESRLETISEGNTSTVRGKQRNNRTLKCKTPTIPQ